VTFSNVPIQSESQAETSPDRDVLSQFELANGWRDWMRPQGLRGFSGAEIWRIETAGGPLCLRRWPADSLPVERLRGLHRLLAHVFAQGVVQVPVPLASRSGTTVVLAGGREWQLEPWMPGSADFEAHPTDERLAAVMACLACWHRAAATFIPRPPEVTWFASAAAAASPGLLERWEQIRHWTPARLQQLEQVLLQQKATEFVSLARQILQLFAAQGPRVRQLIEPATAWQVPVQPCLRDVWHDHVLFTEDRVTGLIDFGSCRGESRAADLARLLGSLIGDDVARRRTAIQHYERMNPLEPREHRLIELFDQTEVLLSGMTWLDWIVVQGRRFSNPSDVLPRLQRIVGRLKLLAQRA
jgi:homoserine kinase type II